MRSIEHRSTAEHSDVNASQWFLSGCPNSGQALQHIFVNAVPFRVGRRAEMNLVLSSSAVSKVHAELIAAGGALFLRDLQSTNGTFLNGRRIRDDATVSEGDLMQFADTEFRVQREPAVSPGRTVTELTISGSWVLSKFDVLMNGTALIPYFQPLVALSDQCVVGYEVLARSELAGLKTPREMFEMAARLNREEELSRACRQEGVRVGGGLPGAPHLFLNTHPAEPLLRVLDSLCELRAAVPDRGLTLEIHEAVVTNPNEMREFRAVLRDLDIRLAYDDFGAGQARLVDLVQVPPDWVKFDIGLVRGISTALRKQQQVVGTLVRMVRDCGVAALAEGIETADDAAVCRELGFEFAQGYYFGRPAPLDSYLGGK
jgi:EAL domain-containing protein (putative c-di-GMP-specific phosphodiesterase class I)